MPEQEPVDQVIGDFIGVVYHVGLVSYLGTSAAHNNPTRPSSKTSTGPNSPVCVTADRGDNGAKRRRDEVTI